MKKSSLILAGLCLMATSEAKAATPMTFDDASSIVVAKAVKLGRSDLNGSAYSSSLATGGTSTSTPDDKVIDNPTPGGNGD